MIKMNPKAPTFLRRMIFGCLSLVLAAPAAAAGEAPFGQIVVFGTSLSDPGNAFALAGEKNVPPDYFVDSFLVPSAPYAQGGHHFSNGETWIEQLGRSMGLTHDVSPAFRGSSDTATNFAVGGARARDVAENFSLSLQVSAFLEQSGGVAPPDALYVIEMGGNDIRDALFEGPAVIGDALDSVAANIGTLYQAGARKFLVWSAPNVGLTPAIRILDTIVPGVAHFATLLTQGFNTGLKELVSFLPAVLPGIEIVPFDAYGMLSDIVASPAAFGLTNVTMACITPGVAPFACRNPDSYLFWDGIHPTRAVHAILAQHAAGLLAVEP
jgi:phospholipase/lecithinase/hemolysin